jgi:hypothetical protein
VNRTITEAPCSEDEALGELELAAIPSAAGQARQFAEEFLGRQDLGEMADTVCLVVSELVTNAVKAVGVREPLAPGASADGTKRPVVLTLQRMTARVLRIEVWDDDPRPPVPVLPAAFDEGGRGLLLVSAMAAAWGHCESGDGKVTWAEIPVPPGIRWPRRPAHPVISPSGTHFKEAACNAH